MMKKTTFLFLLFFFLFQKNAEAQQRFKAGIIVGLNAAQVEGDDSAGYNKLGLHGGLRVVTVLRDKMDFVIEMLYSQRGSFHKGGPFGQGDLEINLRYVEIPLLVTYKDWYQEEEDYYKVQAIGGFSYGRLFDATAIGSLHDAEVGNFHKNDYSFTIGADFFATKHFALGARWNRSLNLLYNNEKHMKGLDPLYGYFISFRGMYIF
ncbi:MAG: PorT family protein [Bacteroidetes bacterium]|nr:PorT family protein [Bacteroidota bacterium]